ncbi:hypothetical protein BDR04DRAFT_237627 [Suillus decipiens]|nr:hypothetical protein BDR04DRAFT_237627 [Suillus decipiens]
MISSTSANVLQQPLPSPLIGLFDGGSGVNSSSSSRSQSPLLLSVPPGPSRTNSPTLDTHTAVGGTPSQPQWTPVLQERFKTHVANITASCGFSFNWVENQAVRSFMNEFFPFANSISSYQPSNHIIPHEVERF